MWAYVLYILTALLAAFNLAKDWNAHKHPYRRAVVIILIVGLCAASGLNTHYSSRRASLERQRDAAKIDELKAAVQAANRAQQENTIVFVDRFKLLIEQGRQINAKQLQENSEQRHEFSDVLNQGRQSIGVLKKVTSDIAETSALASGGTSFPVFFPYEFTSSEGKFLRGFVFHKQGKYPLYDVVATVGRPFINTDGHSLAIPGALCKYPELNGNQSIPTVGISIGDDESAYFEARTQARNGDWLEIIDLRRVGKKITSRWVVYEAEQPGVMPNKAILDLADQDFPETHRRDILSPLEGLNLPALDHRQKLVPDIVLRPTECELHTGASVVITIGGPAQNQP